ncbi:uncharacterized protein LOC131357744 isoform X1 [Hemibagrus wyckioides]|uniref:uncharacterized protein LOC131357744 isoform X1 n=1 Tax=Hemibagrus wyckioides TaxID=337641 RepID=UPI00266C803A|nr:uncharacterized protein LOC131357744 isoform X1 [Hemibagrus wyckioides]
MRKWKMSDLWILILIFSTMFQPDRHWVTAQSATDPSVYQPDKELSVNIGDSATLQCCILEKEVGLMVWFKQPNRKKPQIIVTVFKSSGEAFHNGFQNSRFQIERSSNCFNMIILNIIQSDEAMYYCALTRPNIVFGDGTYLKIKGEHVTIVSETSKTALWNNSVVCEPTPHGNNTNSNTQHKSVISLGTALGLCALLIFCLTYYILRRRKRDKSKWFCHEIIIIVTVIMKNTNKRASVFIENTSLEDSPGTRQEFEAESLNYAALQFSKRKAKAEKRKPGSSDECVYSDVKKTVRCNIDVS